MVPLRMATWQRAREGHPVVDAFDDALMETVIGLFKTECIRTSVIHAGPFRTIADVEWATAGWVDWYNNRRLHSTLEMMTPQEFEDAHYAALNRELQPVWERHRTWGVSMSLPLTRDLHASAAVSGFFEALLPEQGPDRESLELESGESRSNVFGLLAYVGRDLPGLSVDFDWAAAFSGLHQARAFR